jgi:thiol-disulfide isomerase/thioredoxin
MKKLLTWSNALNAVIVVVVVVVFVNPQAKALVIKAFIKIGFFKAPVQNTEPAPSPAIPAVALSFIDTRGKLLNTADHKGKVIFVNLWATWCPPCIAEMPSVNQMYARYRDNPKVMVVTVDVDNDFAKSLNFLTKNGYQLSVYQLAAELPQDLFTGTIPTTIIIDKAGTVVAKHEGAANYADEKFYAYLDGLIAQ